MRSEVTATIIGVFLVGASYYFINHPLYGLYLINPIILVLWYVSFYGGWIVLVISLLLIFVRMNRR